MSLNFNFSGLKLSYETFLKLEKNLDDIPFPLLNLTTRQLFFVSYAQTRCNTHTDTSILTQIKRNYSPNKLRVFGAITNLPEFADTFDCPLGSQMNPKEKCDVFDVQE